MCKLKLVLLVALLCVDLGSSEYKPNGGDFDNYIDPNLGDESSEEKKESEEYLDNVEDHLVNFMLYTRKHTENFYLLQVTNVQSVQNSNFNPEKDTKIVIHGWKNAYSSNFSKIIKNAFLERYDANIIVVDWSKQSHQNYISSRMDVTKVADAVAQLIDLLVQNFGMKLSKVHMVGHSLGAHVAGIAGVRLKSGKVARITGLDPAMPMFTIYLQTRLRSDSAEFVDVIHSCGNMLGFKSALGQVDFYPNGGTFEQPGCGFDYKGKCSHSRSYLFFAESIRGNKFMAVKCDNWDAFTQSNCDSKFTIPMGEYTPTWARGKYYLTTNSEAPFARGPVVYPDYPNY